jgi:hypothetical protein
MRRAGRPFEKGADCKDSRRTRFVAKPAEDAGIRHCARNNFREGTSSSDKYSLLRDVLTHFVSTGRPLQAYPTIRDRAPTEIGFELAKRSVKDFAIKLRKSEARATI